MAPSDVADGAGMGVREGAEGDPVFRDRTAAIEALITLGKKRGHVSHAELNAALPPDESPPATLEGGAEPGSPAPAAPR